MNNLRLLLIISSFFGLIIIICLGVDSIFNSIVAFIYLFIFGTTTYLHGKDAKSEGGSDGD